MTVHHQYNGVSNQQDATTFSFINLFKSALHVSGDRCAHPQEHFLTVYTAFCTMHRHCCRPVPRLIWNVVPYLSPETCRADLKRLINERLLHLVSYVLTLFHLNRGTGRQQCRCIVPKAVYIQSKSAPEDGRICRPKHVGLI